MKVGVLTFHNTNNFGAVLQTVALCRAIKEGGCDCEVINYNCQGILVRESPEYLFTGKSVKTFISKMLKKPKLVRRYNSLRKYLYDNVSVSDIVGKEDLPEFAKKYDIIIVGSDMLWNLSYTCGDYTFFLDFIKDNSVKRVAFATSAGQKWDETERKEIQKYLKNFNRISVREKELAKDVGDVLGKRIECVSDPTMLVDVSGWKNEAVKFMPKEKNYCLIYMDDAESNCYKAAMDYLACNEKIDCVIEFAFHPVLHKKKNIRYIEVYTIEQFLSYIYNAKMIFTASYHGMLFAIYFHIPFGYANKDQHRLENIADILGLKQCNIVNNRVLPQIEWDRVDKLRENFRDRSLDELSEAIYG